MSKRDDNICCICGNRIIGWGNNPRPVREEGRCCSDCNMTVVLPERLKRMKKALKQPN